MHKLHDLVRVNNDDDVGRNAVNNQMPRLRGSDVRDIFLPRPRQARFGAFVFAVEHASRLFHSAKLLFIEVGISIPNCFNKNIENRKTVELESPI